MGRGLDDPPGGLQLGPDGVGRRRSPWPPARHRGRPPWRRPRPARRPRDRAPARPRSAISRVAATSARASSRRCCVERRVGPPDRVEQHGHGARRVEIVVHALDERGQHVRVGVVTARRPDRRAAGGEGVEAGEGVLGGSAGCPCRRAPGCGSGSAGATRGTCARRSASSRSSRLSTLPRLLDIFSPSASTTNPWCIQWLAKRLPRATAWARSFSWCGKRRSIPPRGGRTPRRAGRGSSRRTRCASPDGPRPTGTATTAHRAWPASTARSRPGGASARRRTRRAHRRRRACRRATGGPAARSPRRSRRTGTRRRRWCRPRPISTSWPIIPTICVDVLGGVGGVVGPWPRRSVAGPRTRPVRTSS